MSSLWVLQEVNPIIGVKVPQNHITDHEARASRARHPRAAVVLSLPCPDDDGAHISKLYCGYGSKSTMPDYHLIINLLLSQLLLIWAT
jgi:hypothetical protein